MRILLLLLLSFSALGYEVDFERAGTVSFATLEKGISKQNNNSSIDILNIEKSNWLYNFGNKDVTYYDITFVQAGEYTIECHLKEHVSLFILTSCESETLSMQELRSDELYFKDL